MLMESWAHRFFELSTELFVVLGAHGRILEANPAWETTVGWAPADLQHEGYRSFIHPEDLATVEARLEALLRVPGDTRLSFRWRCRDGTWAWLAWSVTGTSVGGPLCCTGRRMESAPVLDKLRAGGDVVEPLMPPWAMSDSLPLGLYVVDVRTGTVLYANRRFCQLWGIEAMEESLRRGVLSHGEVLEACLGAGEAAHFLRLHPRDEDGLPPQGDEAVLASGRTLRRLSTPMGTRGDASRFRLFAFEDVTERKRTEEALHRSEQSFRKLIEAAPEVIFVHREQRFIYVNPTMLKTLRYEHASELIGRSIWSIVHPDDLDLVRQRVHAVVARGELAPLREIRYLRRDGTWFDAESAGLPVDFDGVGAVVVMARDITERKRMQAQLLQSDRMVLAGTLAAGVGHEINNPLTYVLANLDSAMESIHRLGGELGRTLPDGVIAPNWSVSLKETGDLLREAHEGATRVRNIVRDLKYISRQEEERRELLDVRESLEFSLKLASSELKPRAHVLKQYEPVPPVYADASRLGQVFLNLVVNAAQAIPEGDPARHRVTLWVRPTPEGGVAVDVSDTGAGMHPSIMARIFDPFFTTKSVGVGTGLGLSICHGIIRGLGGDITVRSEPGQGTTFTVTLPPAPPDAPVREAPPAPVPSSERSGRMLVIDDEPAVGRSLARIIGKRHHVTVVSSGEEALVKLASGAEFDAIFCDLMMPGVTGMDVYERVREREPGLSLRFIFITGGSYTARARQFLERVPNPRIEKPFDAQMIQQLVGEVLAVESTDTPPA
ncbi:PAS domain S-box protein [Myxococcus stipitatus]|uniref:PAS domain S-box protein n=1 Tax=Myxococcus stipitatus TaxID=83455 RepID=UPI001F47A6A9|nr:PAS domain S-box protein [Myxococcus stipitatus]MCE9668544.1 PAS domain S-box protein [Myxococcus stipitatus]